MWCCNLKSVLLANALFSFFSGGLLVTMPGYAARWLGGRLGDRLGEMPEMLLLAVGAGLLVFAAGVGYVATRKPIVRRWALSITAADAAWVLVTPFALWGGWPWLTVTGVAVLLVIAVIVGLLAYGQYRALSQMGYSEKQ